MDRSPAEEVRQEGMVLALNENLKEERMFGQQMVISKGPDKWLLAESLFHDDEDLIDPVIPTFTATWREQEIRLSVNVDSIGRLRNEANTYRLTGVATVSSGKSRERIAERVPVVMNYSTHTRRGFAQVKFE